MTPTKSGWILFLAAIGMMAGLIGHDIAELKSYNELYSLTFIGGTLIHFSTVVLAFVGGRLIPTNSDSNK